MLRKCHQLKLQRINEVVSPSNNSCESPLQNKGSRLFNPSSMMTSYMSLYRIQQSITTTPIKTSIQKRSKQQIINQLQEQIVNKQIKINRMKKFIHTVVKFGQVHFTALNFVNMLLDLGKWCIKISCRTNIGRKQTLRLIIRCCRQIRNPCNQKHTILIHWILKWIHSIFKVMFYKISP